VRYELYGNEKGGLPKIDGLESPCILAVFTGICPKLARILSKPR
jgi:hypothetical protein